MKQRKPNGFFSRMSDEELKTYIKNGFGGKSISEFRAARKGLYKAAWKRNLIDQLVTEGTLKKKWTNVVHYSRLSDDEFKELIRENYAGMALGELSHSKSKLYGAALKRKGLLDELLEEGTIKRLLKKRGPWYDMTNEEIKTYIRENYNGETLSDFSRKHKGLYKYACKMKIIKDLVRENTLRSLVKYLSKISDGELKTYIWENHRGKTLSNLSKNASEVYRQVHKRKLTDELVNDGTIVHEYNSYEKLSDDEVLEYTRQNFGGEPISKLMWKTGLYNTLVKRKLLDSIIGEGTIIRLKRHKGFYSDMTDEQLINYFKEHYQGKYLIDVINEGNGAYTAASRKGLIEELIKQKIIKRAQTKRGLWKSLEYALEQAALIMAENPELIDLPGSVNFLKKYSQGRKLRSSIHMYHGGFPAFREKLRDYLGRPSDKQQLESLLRGYLGGNKT